MAGLLSGQPADPAPAQLKLWLRADGYLDGVIGEQLVEPGRLGHRLRETLDPAVCALAVAGGANPRALWAMTGDALAVRATRLDTEHGTDSRAEVAQICAAAGLPRPRYLPNGSVRRSSCCLLYLVPDEGKCKACPRRPLAERR